MATENESENKINFFEKQHGVSNVDKKKEKNPETGMTSGDKLKLEKHRLDKQDENRKRIAGVVLAIAGLVGIYFNVEYAGWLIFISIFMF